MGWLGGEGLRRLLDRVEGARGSRKLALAIVFLALLLDNLLLTVVVPIIPDYLIALEHEDAYVYGPEEVMRLYNDSVYNITANHLYNMSMLYAGNWSGIRPAVHPVNTELYINENSRVGWLFSSKAIVQLAANPFVGPLTNRYGYGLPLFIGFVIQFLSTILYAFGESYVALFAARAIQGLGSSCTAIAGMTMLAHMYPEDKERSRAMGIALGGLALGVLIGYPFGGIMYEFVGKTSPFLIIAILTLMEGVLMVWVLKPSLQLQDSYETGTPLHILLRDPYILIAAGAILFPEMAMAMLEPTLPIWLIDSMRPPKWQLGTVFLPDSIGYWLGCNAFGVISYKVGRWIIAVLAMLIMGVCLACIPLATHIVHLITPHFGVGLALGMVDAAMMPLLALLVDTRHVAVYGSVYAIAQVAISLGFAVGPSVGGQMVKLVGFPWLMRGMAIVIFIYCPLCYFLRDPPATEENKSILMKENGQVNYTQDDREATFAYGRLEED